MGVCDCDRWMEIWNLVFMQYNRDAEGNITPLPNPSIDTGMGLERVISILNNLDSNYEIPIMQSLIQHLIKQTGGVYDNGKKGFPYRVIADHIRSCAFLIADGVLPGNEGRSYVLRRILRRAVRFGKMLGFEKPFMCDMVPLLAELMGKAYPELVTQQDFIIKVIRLEEERFLETINDGLALVAEVVESLKAEGGKIFSGEKAFRLYDTFGFPLDLTVDIAEENGFEVDKEAFQKAMDEQRQRARAARNEGNVFGEMQELTELLVGLPATGFVGYDAIKSEGKVLALLTNAQLVNSLTEGQDGFMVVDKTPCYAEGGGQCGDKALVKAEGIEALITDTKKLPNGIYLHTISVNKGSVKIGAAINIAVDESRRQRIACNHSVTHLMHYALRKVLGNHVHQAGSMVNEDGLRFDFSHIAALTSEETAAIEDIVNSEILKNHAVKVETMTKDEAVAKGAMAFFGDKYGDTVRMVTIGPSLELCGGIHCAFTGAIGSFKIISESSIGSGTRRIEAITGKKVNEWWQERMTMLNRAATVLKSSWQNVEQRIIDIQEESKQKDKEIQRLQTILAQQAMASIFEKAVEIEGVKMLAEKVEAADMESLRNTMDMLKDKMTSGVAVLAAVADGKVMLVAAVTQDLLKKGVHAGNIVKAAAAACGGGGGGRPDMAQAGGKDPNKINEALNAAKAALQAQLKK
ncbi:MAG: alanine--tRNA ligase, partial [Clostridia bacterium]|nr:alanine--tRNA ligase [Clostridia bacterium]